MEICSAWSSDWGGGSGDQLGGWERSLGLQDGGAVHKPSASTSVPCPFTRVGSCPVILSGSAGGMCGGLGQTAS